MLILPDGAPASGKAHGDGGRQEGGRTGQRKGRSVSGVSATK